jgi:hypothetical protein
VTEIKNSYFPHTITQPVVLQWKEINENTTLQVSQTGNEAEDISATKVSDNQIEYQAIAVIVIQTSDNQTDSQAEDISVSQVSDNQTDKQDPDVSVSQESDKVCETTELPLPKESSKMMLDNKADTEEARELTVIAGGKCIESKTEAEAMPNLAQNETAQHLNKQEISSKPPATGETSKEISRHPKPQRKCPKVKNDVFLWI